MNPYLTVIVTTYNREERLAECLKRLKNQSLTQDAYELIVINDGSKDSTKEYLDELAISWPELTVIHQKNTGQGQAREHGLKYARGQVVLIMGDDIYAEENFLEEHSKFHQEMPENNYACLGNTEWYPEKEITPFMKWYDKGGHQFAYHKLKVNEEASYKFFYTSNISLKTELLKRHHFDPDFKGYGWEDTELAYRLTKEEDLKIIYRPNAHAYHDDAIEESQLKERMRSINKNAKIFESKHPELKVRPRGLKKLIFLTIGSFPVIAILFILKSIFPPLKKLYWYALMKSYTVYL
ncbi:glycosyltransferase family 2 protein [Candidatus Peregrinibacteria bacterium]|jgi:glycosyltransferase involved in cell wall biosynthesis|nr:glycosyltransferase family 2 protein [Candidatus Peregrinibacteria bacterium]MBT4631898.1 glycosyltransferase family 2 protein [Candidatus Peregrinibacteria bacterium]MBT5516556.1 glycosyltransferase family 2 protein [Candidatus Peregrinibacteria bacterium]